jgi:formate dehydrogenase major subunit
MRHKEPIYSVCTYCGTGCEISAFVENGKVEKITTPKSGAVSEGRLCIKGREGHSFLTSSSRIVKPRVKKSFLDKNSHLLDKKPKLKSYNEEYFECDYEFATSLVAKKLKEIKATHGSESICGIGGARTSCESGYAFQSFIRNTLGSNHIDNCARVCHAPSLNGLKHAFGEGASANPFLDIYDADFILIIGSNTTEAHPIVSNKILEAQKRGATLCVMDVRETTISKKANFSIIAPPESNLLILNMMAQTIIKEKLHDKKFLKTRTKNFKEFKAQILKDSYAKTSLFKKLQGYESLALQIKEVARIYASSRSLVLWGLGVSEHIDGSYAVSAIAHLAMLSGNIGKKGAGVIPLRGQNNVQGSCEIGCMPNYLPDYKPVQKEGLKSIEAFKKIEEGSLKALYNVGEDITHIHANQKRVQEVLKNLELFVTQDIVNSSVTRFADVVFGVKSQYEKYGVYVNAERRLHLSRPLVSSNLRDDWEVLRDISEKLESPLPFKTQDELWEEVRENVSRFRGASYERLISDPNGLQWPVGKSDTPRLYEERFSHEDGLGVFRYKQYQKRGVIKALLKGKNPPLTLVTGRAIYHYNNASQTKESARLMSLMSEDVVEFSHEDYKALGFPKKIRLISSYGESAVLSAKEVKGLKRGVVYSTFHFESSNINFLFGGAGDELTKTSRFKAVEVEVEVV